MFEGATAAVVTPFRAGQVDWPALRALTRHLIAGGLDGIVVLGSTGEGATLSADERRRALETVLDQAKGRVFVIAGTGTNATDSTIQLTRSAKEVGVDGVMLVTPYYNKPTPEGLVLHFEAVARAARARCETRFFSSGVSCPTVRPPTGSVDGSKMGS